MLDTVLNNIKETKQNKLQDNKKTKKKTTQHSWQFYWQIRKFNFSDKLELFQCIVTQQFIFFSCNCYPTIYVLFLQFSVYSVHISYILIFIHRPNYITNVENQRLWKNKRKQGNLLWPFSAIDNIPYFINEHKNCYSQNHKYK